MTVNQYIFQSPSSSQVQVGRLDPSSKQEETSNTTQSSVGANVTAKAQPQEVSTAEVPTASVEQAPPVEIASNSTQLLDVYA